ncbi:TrmH family RNA methyltransferase [Sutcliffiella rhizosphaerae]|uniref:23S rRNA (Uridine(2479)-2'-O)-methyltransferase n=1 Tax=Sutcliffiella rhizosphaerae TaxID=2880967 RepID=A0ABM8YI94_9BACI|nr:RNA methyltransferase [Sutcliffiella rhizosphaerae]CAG9619575.1 23S rRNA (uridine(2479)-2'-O)-methyltransferase [Sutcliffiella rhizosphaerae]
MKYIESVKNNQVKQWKKLHKKKEREKSGTFIIEGFHLIEEALKVNDLVEIIIISEDRSIPKHWEFNEIELIYAVPSVLKEISETETPQGVTAICRIPKNNQQTINQHHKLLMLDQVQDPGNVGTMIRTADAAGMDMVILGEGCADLYSSKVIRSTQGSIFHLPILRGELSDYIKLCKLQNIPVYGTALTNGVVYHEMKPSSSFALILGNEGSGMSENHLVQTDKNLFIPIHGKSESLNVGVAAGILMYYLRG